MTQGLNERMESVLQKCNLIFGWGNHSQFYFDFTKYKDANTNKSIYLKTLNKDPLNKGPLCPISVITYIRKYGFPSWICYTPFLRRRKTRIKINLYHWVIFFYIYFGEACECLLITWFSPGFLLGPTIPKIVFYNLFSFNKWTYWDLKR